MNAKFLFSFFLFCFLFLHKTYADSVKEISFTISSDGPTKDDAVKNALRQAIEEAYGAFVSANTTILDDQLVKDEIVTLSNGSIKSYKELSAVENNNGEWTVTIDGIVSLPHLIKYVRSQGSECEFAGNTFGMQIKLFEIQKENERKVLNNLKKQISGLLEEDLTWDVAMDVQYLNKDFYKVGATIYARTIPENSKKKVSRVGEILVNTLDAIKLSEEEANTYNRMGLDIGIVNDPRLFRENFGKQGEDWDVFYLRNPDATLLLKEIYNEIARKCIDFVLVDNMGRKHDFIASYLGIGKVVDNPESLVKYPFSIEPIPDPFLVNENLFVFKAILGEKRATYREDRALETIPWKKGVFPGLIFPTYSIGQKDHFPLLLLTFQIPSSEIGKYSGFKLEKK